MSFQIFLRGKILGTEEFLRSAANDLEGRAHWASLLSEIIPRALLSELGLSSVLLGSSGGGRFMVVIPTESRTQADEFLRSVAADASVRSAGAIRIVWASTENLGDWSDVRRRLQDDLQARVDAPAAREGKAIFEPAAVPQAPSFAEFATQLRNASEIGWSPEEPANVSIGSGKFTWPLDSIAFARHLAANDQDSAPASLRTLASRSKGRRVWGVLRGSVDGWNARLAKALSIEEHIAMSEMFKLFFAGEVNVLCASPDFWRKISIVQATPDGFVLYGAWDALIAFARELQRVFQIFADANLREQAGTEGKTLSMALALAESNDQALADVYAEAGDRLGIAKTIGRDSIYLFGRVLEWKHLSDASDTRQVMTRLIKDFRCSQDLLNELASFYRESDAQWGVPSRTRNERVDRPWRFHRRINMVLSASREATRSKEFQRLRAELVSDFTGKKAAHVRLRPQGRVALEWTKLETGV